jgi:hypothetical protein
MGLTSGGGVYIVSGGQACAEKTKIKDNHASDRDDDVFGDLTICP